MGNNQSINQPKSKGGARAGAGRKRLDIDSRWIEARGLRPASAAEILQWADERKLWRRILTSDDDRIVLDATKFLVMMRDGKPAQQINVTSTNVNMSVDEIARARSIVREIVGSEYRPTPILTGANIDVAQSIASESQSGIEKPTEADAAPPPSPIPIGPYAREDEGEKKEG